MARRPVSRGLALRIVSCGCAGGLGEDDLVGSGLCAVQAAGGGRRPQDASGRISVVHPGRRQRKSSPRFVQRRRVLGGSSVSEGWRGIMSLVAINIVAFVVCFLILGCVAFVQLLLCGLGLCRLSKPLALARCLRAVWARRRSRSGAGRPLAHVVLGGCWARPCAEEPADACRRRGVTMRDGAQAARRVFFVRRVSCYC